MEKKVIIIIFLISISIVSIAQTMSERLLSGTILIVINKTDVTELYNSDQIQGDNSIIVHHPIDIEASLRFIPDQVQELYELSTIDIIIPESPPYFLFSRIFGDETMQRIREELICIMDSLPLIDLDNDWYLYKAVHILGSFKLLNAENTDSVYVQAIKSDLSLRPQEINGVYVLTQILWWETIQKSTFQNRFRASALPYSPISQPSFVSPQSGGKGLREGWRGGRLY